MSDIVTNIENDGIYGQWAKLLIDQFCPCVSLKFVLILGCLISYTSIP